MAFNTPACCNAATKPTSENFVSTHSFQPNDVPDLNLKRMGTSSEVPWWMSRPGIEVAIETSESRWQRESHTWPDGGGE